MAKAGITKTGMQALFNNAKKNNARFVGVRIETKGMSAPEYIINPYANIAQKLVYYNSAYNDDLTLKANPGIRITAVAKGNSINDVMAWLGEMDA